MDYSFFDYSVSENIIISEFDILGVEPCNNDERVYLVNTDGLAYEIAKSAYEETGLTIGTIYETCVAEINQIDEPYIENLVSLGWISEEEKYKLFSLF